MHVQQQLQQQQSDQPEQNTTIRPQRNHLSSLVISGNNQQHQQTMSMNANTVGNLAKASSDTSNNGSNNAAAPTILRNLSPVRIQFGTVEPRPQVTKIIIFFRIYIHSHRMPIREANWRTISVARHKPHSCSHSKSHTIPWQTLNRFVRTLSRNWK